MNKTILPLVTLCSTLAAATASAETVLAEVDVNLRLYPNAGTHSSTVVNLGEAQSISAVGVLTDWWQKRPTEVRVYDNSTGTKGKLLGSAQFFDYDNQVCGEDYRSQCQYPENPVGRLVVQAPGTVSSVVVETDGLLSEPNQYAQIEGVQVLSDFIIVASNASDSVLAAIAVLENPEFQSITSTSAFIKSINLNVNSDYSKYLFDVRYQLIDIPGVKCVRSSVDYRDYPTGEKKVAEVIGQEC